MSNNWNPFFALANTRGKIDEAFEKRNNQVMKELSEDSLYEIQENILKSFSNCEEIKLTYFTNDRYNDIIGIVSKIDEINGIVSINKKNINFALIIATELL